MPSDHSTPDPRPYPRAPRYIIHAEGRIWSTCKNRFLIPYIKDYAIVKVRVGGKIRSFKVGTMVLETFGGPRPPGHVCRHLDDDKLNNYFSNLAWGTQKQNLQDMIDHGRSCRGSKNANSKLDEDAIRTIREWTGTQIEIARRYGITQAAVSLIQLRINWKHVV